MRVMITRARKQIKDVKKRFADEYTNYNLLEDTLNRDNRLYYDLLGYILLNTDYKIVLSFVMYERMCEHMNM